MSAYHRPRGLAYYGGKSPLHGLSRWITGIIGYDPKRSYCEPFGGMLGVLCCRPPVNMEIVNDVDGDLVNWWLCTRDFTEEMKHRVKHTPRSRTAYQASAQCVRVPPSEGYPFSADRGERLERAVAYHVCIEQSVTHSGLGKTGWAITYSPNKGAFTRFGDRNFDALATRIYNVQVESRDALEILERTAREPGMVIYCDPPYRTADTSPFTVSGVDWEKMTDLLVMQKGRVAVSGYADEWDHLAGWHRFEKAHRHIPIGVQNTTEDSRQLPRTEVLWTNFPSSQRDLFQEE